MVSQSMETVMAARGLCAILAIEHQGIARYYCPPLQYHHHHLCTGGGSRSSSAAGGERWASMQAVKKRRRAMVVVAAGAPEFGARDPFPAEIESKFGDKVLGNQSTDHIILIPPAPALSLAERSCHPLPPGLSPFSLDEAKALLRKVVGWRLLEDEGGLKLQCEWKLKDHASGLELINRISPVAEAEGQPLELSLDEQTHVLRAEIWTESIGGLCENNFILAAKIDQVKSSDLIKRNRFWA